MEKTAWYRISDRPSETVPTPPAGATAWRNPYAGDAVVVIPAGAGTRDATFVRCIWSALDTLGRIEYDKQPGHAIQYEMATTAVPPPVTDTAPAALGSDAGTAVPDRLRALVDAVCDRIMSGPAALSPPASAPEPEIEVHRDADPNV